MSQMMSKFFLLCLFLLLPAISVTSIAPQGKCTTCLPNPLATVYPHNVTGTINATTSILLVSIPYARSLLPARFANSILTHAYTRFSIPDNKYPIVVEATIDHDIRFNDTNLLADFSNFRITFPFIDLLGDGYSSFRYTGFVYLPADNAIVIGAAAAYGITALPAFFDPPDAPYKAMNHGRQISFAVYTSNITLTHPEPYRPVARTLFKDFGSIAPVPLAFYRNVTNQPIFGNNTSVCDNMISFWNTTTSTGAYAPRGVVGDVLVSPPLVPERHVFRGVRGIRAERAFLENNFLPCESLKGYAGTGSGDSG